jgi:hypothetical protein
MYRAAIKWLMMYQKRTLLLRNRPQDAAMTITVVNVMKMIGKTIKLVQVQRLVGVID